MIKMFVSIFPESLTLYCMPNLNYDLEKLRYGIYANSESNIKVFKL